MTDDVKQRNKSFNQHLDKLVEFLKLQHNMVSTKTGSDDSDWWEVKKHNLIHKQDGVSIRLVCQLPVIPKDQEPEQHWKRVHSISITVLARGRGSGYSALGHHNINEKNALVLAVDTARLAMLYERARASAEQTRLELEIEKNTPLKAYTFDNEMVVGFENDGYHAKMIMNQCVVGDAISVRNDRVYKDVEDPNSGEPFFLSFCRNIEGREFAIVTDGEKFHPTSKVNSSKWVRNENQRIYVRHRCPNVALEDAGPIDKALVTAAIKGFLE